MSDLIIRLRYAAQGELFGDTLLEEAADRIEQLEAKLARSDSKEIEAVYRKFGELEATIKTIRELEPIFADTAVDITERVYRADELEAKLTPKPTSDTITNG